MANLGVPDVVHRFVDENEGTFQWEKVAFRSFDTASDGLCATTGLKFTGHNNSLDAY